MEENNFDKEMPLKIPKEWMSFVKSPWFLLYVSLVLVDLTEIKYLHHQIANNIINAV